MTTSVDSRLESVLEPLSAAVNSIIMFEIPVAGTHVPAIVVWLMAGVVTMTIALRALPWRTAGLSQEVIKGKFTSRKDPE